MTVGSWRGGGCELQGLGLRGSEMFIQVQGAALGV